MARGLAAPVLHVGRAGIRRPPARFWGPLFPIYFYSVRGGASLDCRTRRGCINVVHYHYFLARACHAACARDLQAIQDLCRDLGVPLASEKLVLATRCLQFLGITLDSSLQEIRVPPDKLARLRACLPAWRTRQKCTKRELLSLIGVLSFACKVVRPGGIFFRRLIDLSMTWRTTSASPRRPARTSHGGWNSCPAGTVGLSSRLRLSPRRHSGLLPTRAEWGLARCSVGNGFTRRSPPPSALIISMSWSCLPWRSPSIAGARNGMTYRFSWTRTTCRWCRFGRRARVSAPTSCRLCAGFSFSLPSGT